MCSVRSLLSPALWVGIWDYQWNCRKCNYLLQHSLTITDVHDSCACVYIIFMVFTACTFHCVLIIIYLWFTIKHEYSIQLEIILLLMLSPTLLSWLHTWPQVCIKKVEGDGLGTRLAWDFCWNLLPLQMNLRQEGPGSGHKTKGWVVM